MLEFFPKAADSKDVKRLTSQISGWELTGDSYAARPRQDPTKIPQSRPTADLGRQDRLQRGKVYFNKWLSDITIGRYFDRLPLTEIRTVLRQVGFRDDTLLCIEMKAIGRIRIDIGHGEWLCLVWERQPTDLYQITGFIS